MRRLRPATDVAMSILQSLLLGLALTTPLFAQAAPDARHVVVRGPRTLADAVNAALGPVLARRDTAVPVTVVVDVTPYTRDQRLDLAMALEDADLRFGSSIASWRIARLGAEASPPVARALGLRPFLPTVFRKPSETPSTLPALRATLSRTRETRGVVLYLADWHAEDDEGLESLLADLRGQGRALTVVGSEACFTRAWNDGFFPPHRSTDSLYDAQVGRNPFLRGERGVPWHGGDTAFPHWPLRLALNVWSTEFPAELPAPKTWEDAQDGYARPPRGDAGGNGARGVPEDLRERLGPGEQDEDALQRYWFPLPSGFGPYGLMRLAGETGGRYVLWSWNPGGRSMVDYDYARCDLFAPDLRARGEILRDVTGQSLPRTVLRAWDAVGSDRVRLVAVTPPVEASTGRVREMEEVRARQQLPFSWHEARDWREFLHSASDALEALDRAIAGLDAGLGAQGRNDTWTRRWRADAELFRHVLKEYRYALGEGYADALALGKDAWDDDDLVPGLEACDPFERETMHHPERQEDVEKERETLLERYRGTPWGELVSRNRVLAYRVVWRPVATGDPGRHSPAVSDGDRDAPTTPRGGGSSGTGGGPVSGGG